MRAWGKVTLLLANLERGKIMTRKWNRIMRPCRAVAPERKEQRIKYLEKISLFAFGVASLAVFGAPAVVKAAPDPDTLTVTVTLDVACDCRMGSPAFFSGNRGDAWIISGKIFPAGTLPTGTATNDPTQPVNGVAPIGDWTCRGQNALPFPPEVGTAYDASPGGFNTQYFILKDGRALTVEGYALPDFTGERLSVTGGTGRFRGATGDVEQAPFGTNATGCPNFRATFKILPRSVRDASNN